MSGDKLVDFQKNIGLQIFINSNRTHLTQHRKLENKDISTLNFKNRRTISMEQGRIAVFDFGFWILLRQLEQASNNYDFKSEKHQILKIFLDFSVDQTEIG